MEILKPKLFSVMKTYTKEQFVKDVIAGIIVAWQSGNYPFYTDLPISTAFLSALIGIFVGRLLFARSK